MKIRHIEISNFRGIRSLSWRVRRDFNCLIGAGDACKSTILTALDYALSPRPYLSFGDSDFFDLDIEQDIVIQVTLADWDERRPEIREFFQEKNFAQFKCGLCDGGPLPEPLSDDEAAVSVSLRVDKSLEPRWSVAKGPEEREDADRKPISHRSRSVLGMSRLDVLSDYHFTWGRNSILTRLSGEARGDLSEVLSQLNREIRQIDISDRIAGYRDVAEAVRKESSGSGVGLTDLSPKIDIPRRQSMDTGVLSLHEGDVPVSSKGSGSKKLVAVAMQMKLQGGKNISLIDEIETGLEPHRIRGLLQRLKNSEQQVFATTHSPVVVRELAAANLYVCCRDDEGRVDVESLGTVDGIQGPLRTNAEAFLGRKIVVCEGATEIGCLRAYDTYRFGEGGSPVWSLATSYFDSGGAGKIESTCRQLDELGYKTAVVCDNDAPRQISEDTVTQLRETGIHVCQWEKDNSIEKQLFQDIPWENIPELLSVIADAHDTLELDTITDRVRKNPGVKDLKLSNDPAGWPESESLVLRNVMGNLAHEDKWIKRIGRAEEVFEFALPLLPDGTVFKKRLDEFWKWIQNE